MDAAEQPVVVQPQDVAFSATPPTRAAIDGQGRLRALATGDVQVTAALGALRTQAAVRAVSHVDELEISPAEPVVPANGSIQLSALAASSDGVPIAIDPSSVHWLSDGRTLPGGAFVAGPRPARTVVSAAIGGASCSVEVLSGDHAVMFDSAPQPGTARAQWRYASSPSGVPGGIDSQAAPDGAAALRLAYDFSTSTTTRAAYAQTESAVPGKPIALTVDVFGDHNGAWLRGGYRNADGNMESVTIARHIDWQGWKSLRVAIPEQVAWPIVWTRLYLVESSKEAKEQGSVWFRNLALVYPGP
jgi:hypothetical protein